ncbi:hypothetical protein Vretifemale_3547 [Volvox reticuliferus]|nr:hypothetical protein Vretifemale_3547 [Volvox reticuliferus]
MDPSCVTFYAVWAPGADSFETPPEAGIALGGDSGVNWVVLQIHYTNTALTTDLVDNSGFQLNVSTTLRQYDMGFLTLGTLDISIPPGVANYSSTPNLCPRSCTQQMTRPVTMILAGFHMHPLGKSIRTQWFRNGQELPLLGERRAFDFNYQAPGCRLTPGTPHIPENLGGCENSGLLREGPVGAQGRCLHRRQPQCADAG